MLRKCNIITVIAATVVCGFIAQQTVLARQGATDPIPGTSNGATNSGGGGGGGGGGGKSSTPAPNPAPTPAPTVPPISVGPITFAPAGPVNGVMPSCIGDFRIDPYYPTLLDMTLNVNVSSLDVPDGSVLYINVVGTGGTLYPYTSNTIVIIGGAGSCSEKIFVTLGAGLAGVVVTDASGAIVFAGN